MQQSHRTHRTSRPSAYLKQKTYAITRHGKEMFGERLEQLLARRKDIYEQVRLLKEQQADEPIDLAAKLAEVQQLDNEIYRLDSILARSATPKASGRDQVQVGSSVTLQSQGRLLRIVLVDSVEADPSNGFISDESPIGLLLLGRHLDETVELSTPHSKPQRYHIVAIHASPAT